MKVCVLGANGFLGRYFLSKHPDWDGVTRKDVDLVNQKDTERFFNETSYDVVIHCAVKGGSMLNPEDGNVTHDNILMFENVSRVFKGRLIYFSSGAGVRGNPPTDPYGLSKWMIDKRIQQIKDAYTLRIFGCYGSGEPDPHNRDRFKTICKQNGHIIIDKDKYFDFVDIEDVRKVVYEYIHGKRTEKECDLVYKDIKLLSEWATEFGATYTITDTSELGESYISQRTKLM
jgi:nucleoside-diphosphate-sugar epimerase